MNVSLCACASYTRQTVCDALDRALRALGGIERFVKPGTRVLIKPNLLLPVAPEKAATTHPEVVYALIRQVQKAGATPFLGECPGGSNAAALLRHTWSVCGLEAVARETGVSIEYDVGEALGDSPNARFEPHPRVAAFLGKADAVISCAKLKTHGFMGYTGAMKNLFGVVPGLYKAQYHVKYPDMDDFADALVDICGAAKPVLCVVDAVMGMEGNGPSGGTPRAMNFLAAGENPHETDYVLSRALGFEPESVPTLRAALRRGLFDPQQIHTLGDDPTQFAVNDLRLPDHMRKSAHFLGGSSLVFRLTKPVSHAFPHFDPHKCRRCGICVRNCPPKALSLGDKAPLLDRSVCIGCFCCHELCPAEAISLHGLLLTRLLSKR